jgi:hypothetical protein
MVTLVVLLLSAVGIGAMVFWANYDQLSAPSRAATAQPAVQPQDPSPPRVEASDDTMRLLNELRQSVTGLQTSQQYMASLSSFRGS